MKGYHVSRKVLSDKRLIPRVPYNTLEKEDREIKRVCFCASINGCLTAIDNLEFNERLYMYVADIDPYYPTHKQVPDIILTGEVWSLKVVDNLKLIGSILVNGYIRCEINNQVNNQYSYEWNEINKGS